MRAFSFLITVFLVAVANQFSAACDDDPAAVNALKAMKAELKFDKGGAVVYVDVSERDDIDDNVLVHLSGLPKLKRFHAIYTQLTGTGLKHLRNAKHLEVLDLFACPITDEGLGQLSNLTQLRHVNLNGAKVTDRSIDVLARWSKLKYLGILDARLSERGIKQLEAALPDCVVD